MDNGSRLPRKGNDAGRPPAEVPDVPTRDDLWRRVQLARACLNHGRVDPAELLSVLDGVPITDLMHDRDR